MKKNLIALVAVLFVSGMLHAQEKEVSPVTFDKGRIIAGEKIKIFYKNSQTSLADADDIRGVVYLWKDYEWIADEFKMAWADTAWMGEYTVPEGSVIFCPVFKSAGGIDKGGKASYTQFVWNMQSNSPSPSAYIGWGILRNPMMASKYGISGFCDSINSIGNDVMLFWLQNEMRYFPDQRPNTLKYAVDILKINGRDSMAIRGLIRGDAKVIMENAQSTERQLMDILNLVNNEWRDDSLLGVVKKIILQRFPGGILARDEATQKITLAQGVEPDVRVAQIIKLMEDFPPEKFRNQQGFRDKQYYDLLRGLVYAPVIKQHDYSALYKYLHVSPQYLLATYFWHLVQIPYQNGEVDGKTLEPMASALIKEMLERPCEKEQRIYPHSEYVENFIKTNAGQFYIYAKILYDCGRKDEALEWTEKLKPIFNFKNAAFNDFYVELLQATNYSNMVIPAIESSLRENATTGKMLDVLKDSYVTKNKSDKGFDEYVAGLKSKEVMKAQQEKLKGDMIKEKLKPFKLTGLDGKSINSADVNGKILVLDFWATWCAPCKAALPAMQMAVNKFRNDSGVAFYFIATQEKPQGLVAKIKTFIEEKGYTGMNFVCDNCVDGKVGDEVYNRLAKQFSFSGIPLKMIIDGDGYVRWYSVGYMGSPSELVDEISFIVGEIKKEKK